MTDSSKAPLFQCDYETTGAAWPKVAAMHEERIGRHREHGAGWWCSCEQFFAKRRELTEHFVGALEAEMGDLGLAPSERWVDWFRCQQAREPEAIGRMVGPERNAEPDSVTMRHLAAKEVMADPGPAGFGEYAARRDQAHHFTGEEPPESPVVLVHPPVRGRQHGAFRALILTEDETTWLVRAINDYTKRNPMGNDSRELMRQIWQRLSAPL